MTHAISVPFTGEESGGRYLDLHALHRRFCNSKFGARVPPLDYFSYLDSMARFEDIRQDLKFTQDYRYAKGRVASGGMRSLGSFVCW